MKSSHFEQLLLRAMKFGLSYVNSEVRIRLYLIDTKQNLTRLTTIIADSNTKFTCVRADKYDYLIPS
jgi:hypothetical protein